MSRVPPHSAQFESALVAGVLWSSEVFGIAEGIVRAEDFYVPAHTEMWRVFGELAAKSRPIDQVTVRAKLVELGKLESVGGDEFLLSFADAIPAVSSAEHYARMVASYASVRRILDVLHAQAAAAYAPNLDADSFIEATEVAVMGAVRDSSAGAGLVHILEPMRAVLERIRRAADAKGEGVTGVPTGIVELDRLTTGMHPGELVILAGRPGMGKSAFMTGLLSSGSKRGSVACFSMEMEAEMIAARAIAADSNVDLRQMRAATLDTASMDRLNRSVAKLADVGIYVDESPALTVAAIRSRARRLHARHRLSLVVVDYVQLMSGINAKDSRENQISETTRGLKRLAKELKCPIVALSQLNRDVEKRPSKRPQMSDLRESGAIEQDADTIWLLYRRGYYAAQAAKEAAKPDAGSNARRESARRWGTQEEEIQPGIDDGITEIIVCKARNGPPGIVKCKFLDSSAHFVNLERDYDGGDDGY